MARRERPQLLSFDTNAWSNLAKRETALRRSALSQLQRDVGRGSVLVAMTMALLNELDATSNRTLRRRALRTLISLSKAHLLWPNDVRSSLERQHRRALSHDEILSERLDPQKLNRGLDDGTGLDGLVEMDRAGWAKQETDNRNTLRQEQHLTDREAAKRQFLKHREDAVVDWCRHKADDPTIDPRVLPTIWHYGAFDRSRLHISAVEAEGPGRIDPNDLDDIQHYADAAYSACFVTDEKRIHRIAGLCPEPRIRVLKLDDWAHLILKGQL